MFGELGLVVWKKQEVELGNIISREEEDEARCITRRREIGWAPYAWLSAVT